MASTNVSVSVDSNEEINTDFRVSSNGTISSYNQMNASDDVYSYTEINSGDESGVEVWINDDNIFPGITSYIIQNEKSWSKDSTGLGRSAVRRTVRNMMKECYSYRFNGGQKIDASTAEFCFYLESYIAGLYNLHIYPELHAEITTVNNTFHNKTTQVKTQIEELGTKTSELETKEDREFEFALRMSDLNKEDIEKQGWEVKGVKDEVASNVKKLDETRENLEKKMNETKETTNQAITGRTIQEGSIFGGISIILFLVSIWLFMQMESMKKEITRMNSTKKKKKK
jgi:hypothetical protein